MLIMTNILVREKYTIVEYKQSFFQVNGDRKRVYKLIKKIQIRSVLLTISENMKIYMIRDISEFENEKETFNIFIIELLA